MEEQQTTEESTINNIDEDAEEPANEVYELTLSEHRKELIFDNFEPRPGLPRLTKGGGSQLNTKAVLPAHIIKRKEQRQKYGRKSPRHHS